MIDINTLLPALLPGYVKAKALDDKKKLEEFSNKAVENLAIDGGGHLTYLAPTRVNLALMEDHAYSRYPVYRGDDSDVAGLLEVKTLLDELGKPEPALFNDLRPAVFVSESTHAMKLLDRNEVIYNHAISQNKPTEPPAKK